MKNHIILLLTLLFSTWALFGETLYTFWGTKVEVKCGESGYSGISYLYRQVEINEPFAVALNWEINAAAGVRVYDRSFTVYVSGLDGIIHANGDGGGYNRTGKKLIIYRNGTENNYTYSSDTVTYYDDKPCVHNE